ncbi:zinc-binding dehydrogenase [Mycobacterium sp. 663a-19]|uniref:zinc-dependent alcohol dehydrogenase n=1 Tax=Mycobacterium sp. 663a-19 TaxID=2986148 RepID=UPI002D1F0213|nr:zinc-binding dehydrogenase [Mycobacterium sp. 663a-19]MEB3981985.1 zinc-binding dehydrogenase [Mycobacterium sp. 663a-19]
MSDGATARALVLEAPRQLVIRELPVPAIGDDDAVVRVAACGLCGTDHEQYTGELGGGFAFVPGHETVGTIEAIGPRAARRWGVARGDRVAVEVFQSCRDCDSCRRGEYRRCARHGLADMYGFIPVDRAPGLWGGYAEYQYLARDSMVLAVPDGLDAVVATLFNPLGAGIRWGVTVPGTKAGDVVAVLGPGIRGLCAAAAAKDAGAAFVIVTGMGPRDAERLALAPRFGADLAVDVAVDDPVAALGRAAGAMADVVVDVTARAPTAFAQAIALARPAGTVVVAGTRGFGAGAPGFSPDAVVVKELRIIGALGVDVTAYRAALDLLVSGRYPFESLPRRCARLEDAAELLATMAGERDGVPPVHGVLTP